MKPTRVLFQKLTGTPTLACLLCKSTTAVADLLTETDPLQSKKAKQSNPTTIKYHRCHDCCFVFQDTGSRLTPTLEKQRYNEHNNNSSDPRYRQFLSPLATAVSALLVQKPNAIGLDFGCGPGPTLSIMMEEQGFQCDKYDPFFYPTAPTPPPHGYDFIVSSEVFEHLYTPRVELHRLQTLLAKDGILGIMTSRVNGNVNGAMFRQWSYRRDRTHVGFYARESLEYVGQEFFPAALVEFPEPSVCLVRNRT